MQVHETYNMTPYVADVVFSKDRFGKNLVIAIVKACFDFDEKGECSTSSRERMLPVMHSYSYHDTPERSGIKYPVDIVPEKKGTDIIINGHVYGHGQKEAVCGFDMGDLKKKIVVFGKRFWVKRLIGLKISEPLPFSKIPLLYDHAFGGSYDDPEKGSVFFEENPIGKGFEAESGDQAPLPHFEYPDKLIKSLKNKPTPAGLSAIPRSWKQRSIHAGTYDENWKTQNFPSEPLDFNIRFFNAVPDDQIFKSGLSGGETLVLYRLHSKKQRLRLSIPDVCLSATFRIKEQTVHQKMVIDTCLVEPDEGRLSLTCRSTLAMDDDVRYLKSVHLELNVNE